MVRKELLAFFFLGLAAFLLSLEALFLALRALLGALDQFGTNQFQHGQLRAITLARSEARDAGVAAGALAEAAAEGVEQLLHRLGRGQK